VRVLRYRRTERSTWAEIGLLAVVIAGENEGGQILSQDRFVTLPAGGAEAHHELMLTTDQLTRADETADEMFSFAGADRERPPSVRALSITLLHTEPQSKLIVNEGEICPVNGVWQITTRQGIAAPRVTVVYGHELSHWWRRRNGGEDTETEEFHDAVGARLAAPAIPFRRALRHYGHSVHALAKAFHTTQSVAMLRIAELEGRPGLVNGSKGRIVRGADFDWPEDLRTVPRSRGHLVRVDNHWGMMAHRATQSGWRR